MNKWNVDMGFHYFVTRERHKGTLHHEYYTKTEKQKI